MGFRYTMGPAELSIHRVLACSCMFLPKGSSHVLSCAEAQGNAGLVFQWSCSILSATQTVLFSAQKFLSHWSPPVAQKNHSQ